MNVYIKYRLILVLKSSVTKCITSLYSKQSNGNPLLQKRNRSCIGGIHSAYFFRANSSLYVTYNQNIFYGTAANCVIMYLHGEV
jgi:hypothetical protein